MTKECRNDFSRTERCRNVLKVLLVHNNINVSELARRINLPQPTIHRLLMGKTDDPKLSTLSLIADYFSVTIDQLLGHAPLTNTSEGKCFAPHSMPVISWQEAMELQNLKLTNCDNWILTDIETSVLSFCLKTKKSMEPRFAAGTILLVDPKLTPVDGDIVIVSYPYTTEATIRELVLDGPKNALISITDSSQSQELKNDIKLIGVVMEARFSYR